jgi:serine/threonine protein kinase
VNAVGGRYLLKEQLGSGGMGVVWLAHDELLHREVAVKQLKLPNLAPAASEVARTRALREARIAARLAHPNAITVYDVVVEDDLPWIVMEYLPSRSLAALLDERGPLTPAEAARIGEKTAMALAAAHAAGIVHRDVKPGNVLIGHDGAVKLTDFGISRATGDVTITEVGAIAGTPAYLAPEVARGEAPDTRSDMFSLGATLYAAVESRSPYGDTDNNLGLLYRAATGAVERPTRAGSLLRPLELLLAVDPAARPTASQAVALLEVLPTEVIPTPVGIPVHQPSPRPPARTGHPAAPPVRPSPPTPVRTAAQAGTPPPSAAPPVAAARPKRRWLLPVVVLGLLVVLVGALSQLPLGGGRGDGTAHSPTKTSAALNPTSASNFVLGWFRSTKHETRSAWDKMEATTRPTYEEFAEYAAGYDELVPDSNPEVAARDGGFLVTGKITLTKIGKADIEVYKVLVTLVDGELKIAEYKG